MTQRLAGGLVGLTVAMLLETLLLILRTSFPPELESSKQPRRGDGVKQTAAQQQAQPEVSGSGNKQRQFSIGEFTPPQEKKLQ